MKFGAMVATKIDDWRLLEEAEELGYDHGWVPDSQMIWSDCYATLALAAANTSRIVFGTGVAIAPTRLAPVTAHSIASIHKLAPGRVFLGIGSGHTAMRVMGMDPMSGRAFREYLRVVRGLLDGEEVEFTHGGVTRPIQFGHRELEFIGLEPRIPIWVAANGPIALRAAGEFGDGRISAGNEPSDTFARSLSTLEQGAAQAGRSLPPSTPRRSATRASFGPARRSRRVRCPSAWSTRSARWCWPPSTTGGSWPRRLARMPSSPTIVAMSGTST